jgi:hypothetical protein
MKGEFVEPHSEKKGSLGGKFEDYTHTPSDAVWDRIAEQPTDRPLGAMFGAFAWMPKARVWRRISAELHPVPYLRIAQWTTAAAAAVAILLLFQWSKPAAPSATGKGFAHSNDVAADHAPLARTGTGHGASATDLNAGSSPAMASMGGDPSGLHHGPQDARTQGRRQHGRQSAGIQPNPSISTNLSGGHDSLHAKPSTISAPIFAYIDLQSATGIAPDLQAIDQRTAFFAMLDLERQKEAQSAIETAILENADHGRHAESSGLLAQAGANLSAGGMAQGKFYNLDDFEATNNSGVGSLAQQDLAGRRASTEQFQTPLVIGALVEHGIAPRVALGGGVVYTKMQSSEKLELGPVSQRIGYTRQYLGLAAQATYSVGLSKRSDRLGLYGMAGLQYDFGLVKSSHRETVELGLLTKAVGNEALGGQASVNGGLGLRYAILKRVSLYAQGTGSCYFYTSEANLYTQRIIWPSMQVGMRLAL